MLKLALIPLCLMALIAPAFQNEKAQAKPGKPIDFKKKVAPFVKKYCASCHSGDHPADGIDFSKFKTQADVDKNPRAFRKAGREVNGGQMPPKAAQQPTDAEKKMFVDYCAQVAASTKKS